MAFPGYCPYIYSGRASTRLCVLLPCAVTVACMLGGWIMRRSFYEATASISRVSVPVWFHTTGSMTAILWPKKDLVVPIDG